MTETAQSTSPFARNPISRFDLLTIVCLLIVAFLSSSFVARNSDFWLHMATGRLLANGTWQFGTDPFSHTLENRYWANHSWLFDAGLYLTHESLGPALLIVLKALVVVATAGLMLLGAWQQGTQRWVAAGCVLAGIVAMSPRLLLQPSIISFLLLSGCFYCLSTTRFLAAIPVLIALWVNVDNWFLLGPALVFLFWLGRRLDPDIIQQRSWPWWFFPACMAACLISPHHVFALRLPMELSPWVLNGPLASDPRFSGIFASPWRGNPLGAAGGYNPSAWAYFLLLALGFVSFAANLQALRTWRGTVWLAFAVLSAWQARLIPFFAVVAAPITAINLACLIYPPTFSRVGRAVVLAVSVMMLVAASLGWTLGLTNRDRAVVWKVHTDQALQHAAMQLQKWRALGNGSRTFITHPDLAHYMAWFTPGERAFLDSRLHLFTEVANDFEAISRTTGVIPGEPNDDSDALARHAIGSIAVYDPDANRMANALATAGRNSHWPLGQIEGGTIFLSHNGPPFSAEHAAFSGGNTLPVAERGPGTMVEQGGWKLWRQSRARKGSWPAETASIYVRLADSQKTDSPALSLLAVRAARCGVETDPNDPIAWLALGRAYLTLGARSWEREKGADLAPLEHVRFIQATGALVQAALLNPDSATTHDNLARLFARRNVLDLASHHADLTAHLVRWNGRFPGESTDSFHARSEQSQTLADSLEGARQDAENRYLIRTIGQAGDPLSRAKTAAELGLTQKAIDVLLTAHPDLYGAVGVGMLAELLLQTGQVAECRVLLDRDEIRRNPTALGIYNLPKRRDGKASRSAYRLHAYDWLDFCQRSAAGQYNKALLVLDQMILQFEEEEQRMMAPLIRGATSFAAGEVGLAASPRPALARLAGIPGLMALTEFLTRSMEISASRGDLTTLAGVLELERGHPTGAMARFRAALGIYAASQTPAVPQPGKSLAQRYDQALRGSP